MQNSSSIIFFKLFASAKEKYNKDTLSVYYHYNNNSNTTLKNIVDHLLDQYPLFTLTYIQKCRFASLKTNHYINNLENEVVVPEAVYIIIPPISGG